MRRPILAAVAAVLLALILAFESSQGRQAQETKTAYPTMLPHAAQLGGDLFDTQVTVGSPRDIPYPNGFRRWTHVKTVLVGPQSPFFQDSGGIHHIYANEKAMEGYSTGKFPDGSVLIFDLLGTKEKDGVIAEGTRQRVDVMLKDSKQFSLTGGWGFERFLGDSEADRPLTEEHRKLCFTCHEQVKEHDFVFSVYRK